MATFIRGDAIPGAKAYRLYDCKSAYDGGALRGNETLIYEKKVERTFSFIGTVDASGKPKEDFTPITASDTKALTGKFPIMQTNQNGKCYYKFTGSMTVKFNLYGGGTVTDYENFEAYLYTDSYKSFGIKFNGFDFEWNDPNTYDYQKLYINIIVVDEKDVEKNEKILFRTLTSQDLPINSITLNGSLNVYHADDDFKHTEFIPVANLSNVYENGNGQLIEQPFCATGFSNSENNDIVMAFYDDASFATATGTEITKYEAGGTYYISAETVQGYANGAEYVVFFARGLEQQGYANAGGIDFNLDDYEEYFKPSGTYHLGVQAAALEDKRFEDSDLSKTESYTYTAPTQS